MVSKLWKNSMELKTKTISLDYIKPAFSVNPYLIREHYIEQVVLYPHKNKSRQCPEYMNPGIDNIVLIFGCYIDF